MPESVCTPAPFFTSESGPTLSWSTPAKAVLVPAPPVVSVAAPTVLRTKPPAAPASEPMLLLLPARSRMPVALTVTAEFTPKACVEPARSVPVTFVAPM